MNVGCGCGPGALVIVVGQTPALPSEDPMPEELIDRQLLQDWVCM